MRLNFLKTTGRFLTQKTKTLQSTVLMTPNLQASQPTDVVAVGTAEIALIARTA